MARAFNEGPLTVAPAKTYSNPKANYNDDGDARGSIPGSTLARGTFSNGVYTPSPYLQANDSSLGSPVTYPLPVSLCHIPGNPDPQAAFVVSASTDMGALFSQGQLDAWNELAQAIFDGLLTATAAGTVPSDTPL